jgi:hypothetical protein
VGGEDFGVWSGQIGKMNGNGPAENSAISFLKKATDVGM